MRTIYKYPLALTDHQSVETKTGAKFIHVGLDPHGVPCLWMLVDPQESPSTWQIWIVGTGNPMPPGDMPHLGSFTQGPFMWHVFCL